MILIKSGLHFLKSWSAWSASQEILVCFKKKKVCILEILVCTFKGRSASKKILVCMILQSLVCTFKSWSASKKILVCMKKYWSASWKFWSASKENRSGLHFSKVGLHQGKFWSAWSYKFRSAFLTHWPDHGSTYVIQRWPNAGPTFWPSAGSFLKKLVCMVCITRNVGLL